MKSISFHIHVSYATGQFHDAGSSRPPAPYCPPKNAVQEVTVPLHPAIDAIGEIHSYMPFTSPHSCSHTLSIRLLAQLVHLLRDHLGNDGKEALSYSFPVNRQSNQTYSTKTQ